MWLLTLLLTSQALAWDVNYHHKWFGEKPVVWCHNDEYYDINVTEVENFHMDDIWEDALAGAAPWESTTQVPIMYMKNPAEVEAIPDDKLNTIVFIDEDEWHYPEEAPYNVHLDPGTNALKGTCYKTFDLEINLGHPDVQDDLEPMFLEAWGIVYGLNYSGYPGAVMEPGLVDQPTSLTEDDINGILYMYGPRGGCSHVSDSGGFGLALLPLLLLLRRRSS